MVRSLDPGVYESLSADLTQWQLAHMGSLYFWQCLYFTEVLAQNQCFLG